MIPRSRPPASPTSRTAPTRRSRGEPSVQALPAPRSGRFPPARPAAARSPGRSRAASARCPDARAQPRAPVSTAPALPPAGRHAPCGTKRRPGRAARRRHRAAPGCCVVEFRSHPLPSVSPNRPVCGGAPRCLNIIRAMQAEKTKSAAPELGGRVRDRRLRVRRWRREQFIGLGLLSDAAVLARSAADLHDAREAHLVRLRSSTA